jgi:hypothetical protein
VAHKVALKCSEVARSSGSTMDDASTEGGWSGSAGFHHFAVGFGSLRAGMSGAGLAVQIWPAGLGLKITSTLLATADEVISRSCCGA